MAQVIELIGVLEKLIGINGFSYLAAEELDTGRFIRFVGLDRS
ncbi:hypothetical protein [Breoghania sp.]|nr:hypothetical protein [Breoghania sp.]MDJ0930419.1 hypothetical protein [Breoghania sp.]